MKTTDLTDEVAGHVRAELARQRISGSGLAKALGWPPGGLQRRLTGKVPFTIDELDAIAKLLGVPLSQFWPNDLAS